jgi:hypothetical protein
VTPLGTLRDRLAPSHRLAELSLDGRSRLIELKSGVAMKKIFVSGTYLDLVPYREAVITAIRKLLKYRDVDMESFGAHQEEPTVASLHELDQCDIYLGIIGHRYGHLTRGQSVSRAEYERAVATNKRLFLYLADDEMVTLSSNLIEDDATRAKQRAFRELLAQRHTPYRFKSPADLAIAVLADLHMYLDQLPPEPNRHYQVFGTDLDPVKTILDARRYSAQSEVASFVTFLAEYFKPLFALESETLEVHPLFKAARGKLTEIIPEFSLRTEDGIILRTGVRHVILRTHTVIPLMGLLTAQQLRTIGRQIGITAAQDLVDHTLEREKFVPSGPEAFVALWNYWDRTGGWGTYELSREPEEGEWRLRVVNSFLRSDNQEESARLINFWCGYIQGFLNSALPAVSGLMLRLPDDVRNVTVKMPAGQRVSSVHQMNDPDPSSDLFLIRFEPERLAEAFSYLSEARYALSSGQVRHSLGSARDAWRAARRAMSEQFENLMAQLDGSSSAVEGLAVLRADTFPREDGHLAGAAFAVASRVIKELALAEGEEWDVPAPD